MHLDTQLQRNVYLNYAIGVRANQKMKKMKF